MISTLLLHIIKLPLTHNKKPEIPQYHQISSVYISPNIIFFGQFVIESGSQKGSAYTLWLVDMFLSIYSCRPWDKDRAKMVA